MGIFNLANLGILAWFTLVGFGITLMFEGGVHILYGLACIIGAIVWFILYAMHALTHRDANRR